MAVKLSEVGAAIAIQFPVMRSVEARIVDRGLIFIDLDAADRDNGLLCEVRAWAMLYVVPAGYEVVAQWRAF